MTFFEDVPTPLHLDSTTVYGRARRIGQGIKNVETEMLSTWDWTDTCKFKNFSPKSTRTAVTRCGSTLVQAVKMQLDGTAFGWMIGQQQTV
eukprot:COSAG02_NODE_11612_length_1690_cov_1.057197_1_plen_90_part_10